MVVSICININKPMSFNVAFFRSEKKLIIQIPTYQIHQRNKDFIKQTLHAIFDYIISTNFCYKNEGFAMFLPFGLYLFLQGFLLLGSLASFFSWQQQCYAQSSVYFPE